MGRPIKESYIGNVSTTGKQIECYAWGDPLDTQARLSYIQKQLGTGRYYAVSANGAHAGEVTLVNTDSGNLAVGQASVSVTTYADGVKYAKVIYDNTVRTWDNMSYTWYFEGVSLTEPNSATLQSD